MTDRQPIPQDPRFYQPPHLFLDRQYIGSMLVMGDLCHAIIEEKDGTGHYGCHSPRESAIHNGGVRRD